MLKVIASFALAASLADPVLAQPLPTSADHTRILNEVVPANQATHLPVKSGLWSDPAVWQHGLVPKQGDTVLIPEGFSILISGSASAHWCRIEGKLGFDPKAESHLMIETIVVDMPGSLEIGTESAPIEKLAVVEFIDNGPIKDWSQLGRGLIVMGDLSVYGKETTSFVHVAKNPRKGDSKLTLSETPKNWDAGSVIVVPGVRPPLPIPDGKRPPVGPEGRDPVFKKQHELRTITGNACTEITLNAPLEYDLHHQTDGVNIPIGCLTRNIVFRSQSKEVSRRGHIMVMPITPHEYTIAYATFEDLGRTSQEQHLTDPQQDAAGNVIPATAANPRGRYPLHFHKNGFATHATVKGCAVRNGLKWGVVNHSSNVDFLDCIAYDVRGAGFSTEIGCEIGSFQRCLSVCNLGFGDLNESPTRRGRQASKGRSDLTAAEKVIAPLGPDFGFNGAGFWLQGSRLTLTGNEVYGMAGTGFDIEPLPFGTDHLGRRTAIYVSDLTPEEKARLVPDPRTLKLSVNNYPLTMTDCVAMGGMCGVFDWVHPIGQQFGGSTVKNFTARNCARAVEIGDSGYEILDNLDAVNDPTAMNKRTPGPTLDLYNRVDVVVNNLKAKGFNIGVDSSHNGFVKVTGANTRLDCITNIKVRDGKQELSIEIGEQNFATPSGRNIVFDSVVNRPVFWREPGELGLKLVPIGTAGGVQMPELVSCVAVEEATN